MATTITDIEQLNDLLLRQQARWRAGSTPLSNLTADQRARRLGFTPPPNTPTLQEREQLAKAALTAHKATSVSYPNKYDLRNVDGKCFITPVLDQGGCGSCVAFGSLAAVEGTMRVQSDNPDYPIALSEAHLFYCYARSEGRRCNTGWWIEHALSAVQKGVVDDSCYPYTPEDQDCTGLCADWQKRLTKISGFHSIKNADDMKTWLSTRGPLVTAFTVYEDFFYYTSGVYHHVKGVQTGAHCVAVVGYDDVDEGGYWICKDSNGVYFGEYGFFRIGYGECGIDYEMYAIETVTPPSS